MDLDPDLPSLFSIFRCPITAAVLSIFHVYLAFTCRHLNLVVRQTFSNQLYTIPVGSAGERKFPRSISLTGLPFRGRVTFST